MQARCDEIEAGIDAVRAESAAHKASADELRENLERASAERDEANARVKAAVAKCEQLAAKSGGDARGPR